MFSFFSYLFIPFLLKWKPADPLKAIRGNSKRRICWNILPCIYFVGIASLCTSLNVSRYSFELIPHHHTSSRRVVIDISATSILASSSSLCFAAPLSPLFSKYNSLIFISTLSANNHIQIHLRSHTKERPFKCRLCERGFTTKGNFKQHLLTHNIAEVDEEMLEPEMSPQTSQLSIIEYSL